jgi:hypothetical protein
MLVANEDPKQAGIAPLTPQPLGPKLRHSNHMQASARRTLFLILLLGAVFLSAQFHFCADLTGTPSASHICPVCSTVGSAVATPSPSIAIIPVVNRLEILAPFVSAPVDFLRTISPRAPPAL